MALSSEDPELIIRAISFELVQIICPGYLNITDGWTDGRTTYDSNTALPLLASRGKKGSAECTAKIWVFAQTPPVNRSLPNFAREFMSRMSFYLLSFREIGRKMCELWGVDICLLPLKRHIADITACCCRTAQAVIK